VVGLRHIGAYAPEGSPAGRSRPRRVVGCQCSALFLTKHVNSSILTLMIALTKEVEITLLNLSAVDRVNLAEKLLSSLDSPQQHSIDEKWSQESEDRIKAYDAGLIKSFDISDVFERLEKKYNQ
jgi:putative addiction module component (TIGR02574 family)